MRSVLHFAILAGTVVIGLQLAPVVLNALGVAQADGFGWDDVIEAAVITGTSMLGLSLIHAIAKA